MPLVMDIALIGLFVAIPVASWWLTRRLRKSWYPRFAIEIAAFLLFGFVGALALAGAAYDQSHINRGEPE